MSESEETQMPMMANVPAPGWRTDFRSGPRPEAQAEASPPHSKKISLKEAENAAWAKSEASRSKALTEARRFSQEIHDAAWAKSPASSSSGYRSSTSPTGGPTKEWKDGFITMSTPWPNDKPPGKRAAVEDDHSRVMDQDMEHERKRMKIHVNDSSTIPVCLAGNSPPWDTKTVECELHTSPNQVKAIWLIVEPSRGPYDAYGKSWFRPATQLSDLLEGQLSQNIGLQTCTLTYPPKDGESTVHYFEHDLTGDKWMQRRYYDPEHSQFRSQKQIMRVRVGF
jgi:hypothetical protein